MARRGRPAVDTEWHALISRAVSIIPNDEKENLRLVEMYLTGEPPQGCRIRPGNHDAKLGVWLCQFYIGREQRTIGTGTLYQCARLYDAALVRFEKFRSSNSGNFNFSRSQAVHDNTQNADLVSYLCDLESLLKSRSLIEDRSGTEKILNRIEAVERALADLKKCSEEILSHVTPPTPQPIGAFVQQRETAAASVPIFQPKK